MKDNLLETDVVVIGAGPNGSMAAFSAAKKGLKSIIAEEHPEIGIPAHCAGLLSVKGLKRIGVTPPSKAIENKSIKGAHFFSPSGKHFSVERNEVQAYVVDRREYDKWVASKAKKKGTEIMLNSKIEGFIQKNGKIEGVYGKTRKKDTFKIKADIVIDAEGHTARLLRQTRLPLPDPSKKVVAVQYEMANVYDIDSNFVEIYFGKNVAPGFFAWIIPQREGFAKVGLAANKRNAGKLLKFFVKKNPLVSERLKKAIIRELSASMIPLGGPPKKTFTDSFVSVGDAAGQTKPTTGGGVITGGLSALYAGYIAAKAVRENDTSEKIIKQYEGLCRRALGKEFSAMLLLRKTIDRFSDKSIDKLFDTVKKYNLVEEIEEKGDIDMQSHVIRSTLRHPRVVLTLISAIFDSLISS